MTTQTYAEAVPNEQTGWCYSQAGTPCAYIMPLDRPEKATVIGFDTWFNALRFAVVYAAEMGAEYMGGPRDE